MNNTTDRDSAKPLGLEFDQEAVNDYREEHRGYCDDAHQMAREQDGLNVGKTDYCDLCGGSGQIGTDLCHAVVMLGFSDWELVVVHSYDCMLSPGVRGAKYERGEPESASDIEIMLGSVRDPDVFDQRMYGRR